MSAFMGRNRIKRLNAWLNDSKSWTKHFVQRLNSISKKLQTNKEYMKNKIVRREPRVGSKYGDVQTNMTSGKLDSHSAVNIPGCLHIENKK